MPGDEALKVTKDRSGYAEWRADSRCSRADEKLQIKIQYEQKTAIRGIRINLQLVTQLGEIAFTTSDHSSRHKDTSMPGTYLSSCLIPEKLFNTGQYTIRLSIDVPGV